MSENTTPESELPDFDKLVAETQDDAENEQSETLAESEAEAEAEAVEPSVADAAEAKNAAGDSDSAESSDETTLSNGDAEVAADSAHESAKEEPAKEPEKVMTDDEVAAAVEAALTGSIAKVDIKQPEATSASTSEAPKAPISWNPPTFEAATPAAATTPAATATPAATTPAATTSAPFAAKPVAGPSDAPKASASKSAGLSGSLGDFQGSTQFVYQTPANVYVHPAIEDAPARKNPFSKASIGVLAPVVLSVGALVGGAIGGAIATTALNANSHSSSSITINNPDSVSWATAAAAKAAQSVVTISVASANGSGIGSGVVLTKDGYILTNTHVVTLEGETTAPAIQVKFADGKIVDGQLVGTDPTNDLAVIKVNATGLLPATFADSTQINVGDSVLAIGAPLGLDATVTKGIVSTLNRTIDEASSAPNAAATGATIHMSVIQTDAAINPGNSGGALVDANGDVIGINVAIATSGGSGGQAGSIGVGFAIPSNIAQRIAKEIMSTGSATHGLLGAQIYNNGKSNVADAFSNGAKVDSLTAGGPGEKAGLKKDDVVIKFNESKVTTASDLTALVRQQPAGATVKLTVVRGSQTITITVVLGNADSSK